MSFNNETQVVSEFNKLNISDKNSISEKINHEYCYDPANNKFWCKRCVPRCIIEGWTSGNDVIDYFIKDTIYNAEGNNYPLFLEWVPFDRFEGIKQIGEGGFAKVFSATLIDGRGYYKQDDGSWIKGEPNSIKVALKRLNGSQNMPADYLNEFKAHWKLNCLQHDSLRFYGITKDPETKEFMMIMQFINGGNLRNILSSNFNKISWESKLEYLRCSAMDLENLHSLRYCHKDFHSGNILGYYVSDFGSSGPSNKQKSDNKVYGVLPYIAPEILNGESYTIFSDIYSFGVVMAELSSGKPPFHNRKHDTGLALEICNGLRPEFGKGTPKFYKKLAHRCMNANSNQRPTASELHEILHCWKYYRNNDKYGYKGKEVKAAFEEADKEIPNISTSYEKNSDTIYTSRAFTFKNLSKSINSPFITSLYLNEEDCQDSQLIDLEVPNTLKSEDGDNDSIKK
ncbi:kinase-like domain-containing protein [Rhizophagus clarus]|uniref:Kinase-like domain-containing protein n=1 Tax=Rhizophagus clarus TaxID=94130 RepID=A0A8H3QSQ5_9GLOM|nr:kinase-like domain-containing protein [Rhizophagus clarus]